MTLAVREATAGDAAPVIALWHACELTRPWNDPQADFDRALAFAGSTIWLAEDAGGVIGTAMTGFDGHRGWIYYLATAPARRGQGIATCLVEACCDWLRDRGCPKVELMVRESNQAAAAYYARIGWERQPVQVFARWLSA